MEGSPYTNLQDEREDIQKKTFTKWINSHLIKGGHAPITDLFYDLRDGTTLLKLLGILTAKKYKCEKGNMRVHHINNIEKILMILQDLDIKLVNISSDFIVDGSSKITLGLIWAIILHWQVSSTLKDLVHTQNFTSMEKTLLSWCKKSTEDYEGVNIKDFSTSWNDGLAFNALIHRYYSHLFEWSIIAHKEPLGRLENAFKIAQEFLKVDRLLDPEDVSIQSPDKKSVLMYVMCLFQALSSSCQDESWKNPSPLPDLEDREDDHFGLGRYQQTLEEVLAWLLDAEDRLMNLSPIGDCTKHVKSQFHELEIMMVDLTSRQESIGQIMEEGARLLSENTLNEEEMEEIKMQMHLLNARWETLRVKAMERQTKLHNQLMELQGKELDMLKKWLTQAEDRISKSSQLGPALNDIKLQIQTHKVLQEDLKSEEQNVSLLSNMVVVVDENAPDNACFTLEDELNALGERWSHICKWSEEHWNHLQKLEANWNELQEEIEAVQKWLVKKETSLLEMESNPTLNRQDLTRHAEIISVLKAEIDVISKRLVLAEERSCSIFTLLTDPSVAQEILLLPFEELHDKMECLISILEAQCQRLSKSGIDIPIGQICITEDSSVQQLKEALEPDESPLKRQKISSENQEEFSRLLSSSFKWINNLHLEIGPSAIVGLSLQEIKSLHSKFQSKLPQQEALYDKVIELGKILSSDVQKSGNSFHDIENELSNIRSKWKTVEEILQNSEERMKYVEATDTIKEKAAILAQERKPLEMWINVTQSSSMDLDPTSIQKMLDECQHKRKFIEICIAQANEVKDELNKLSPIWHAETQSLMGDITTLNFELKNASLRIVNLEFLLNEALQSQKLVKEDETVRNEKLEQLTAWLQGVENILQTSSLFAPLEVMENWSLTYKDMIERFDDEREKLCGLNQEQEGLNDPISPRLDELNSKWSGIFESLVNRSNEIQRGLEKQRHLKEEIAGLTSWLDEVEVFLASETAEFGDIETIQAQLEQSNALQDDIKTLEKSIAEVLENVAPFLENGNLDLKNLLNLQLANLKERWKLAVETAEHRNEILKATLQKTRKVMNVALGLRIWLEEFERQIPDCSLVETTSELNSVSELLANLLKEGSKQMEKFDNMDISDEELSQCDALENDFTENIRFIKSKWNELFLSLEGKQKLIENCFKNYEEFKRLCSEEHSWLDELEHKLQGSDKATDAEEISAIVDDLDCYLRHHDSKRLDYVQSLADELSGHQVMSVVVQNSAHDLNSRFESLSCKALEYQKRLEGGVQEAQDIEREYVSAHENLSSILLALSRLPHENQSIQLKEEIVAQQKIFSTMESKIEYFKSQGNQQASNRLQDQLTLLLKMSEEIESKLSVSEQNSTFEAHLNSMMTQLTQMKHKIFEQDISSIDPSKAEADLDNCLQLYQKLSELKSEIEELIAKGRTLIREGVTLKPDQLGHDLDVLKALYNELGGLVTNLREKLEMAGKLNKRMHKDACLLKEFFLGIQQNLETESKLHLMSDQEKLVILQNSLDDLSHKKDIIISLNESFMNLKNLSSSEFVSPINEQVAELNQTWDQVHMQLSNRISTLKKKNGSDSEEMGFFIVSVGELQAWLSLTENKFLSLSTSTKVQQRHHLQIISSELKEKVLEKDKMEKASQDLVALGALNKSTVQSEISAIQSRFENIEQNIKKMQDSLENSNEGTSKDRIESYFSEISTIVDEISNLNLSGPTLLRNRESYSQIKEFEHKVSLLEPDVATLISKGDTMTLTTHVFDVSKANSIRVAVEDLRRRWAELKRLVESRSNSQQEDSRLEAIRAELEMMAEPRAPQAKEKDSLNSMEQPTSDDLGVVKATGNDLMQQVEKLDDEIQKSEEKTSMSEGFSTVKILTSLDKSILQIRDWLTLMEQMTRQEHAVVGDEMDIRRHIEKQKNVLRELEGKKPQLDDLVASADSLKDDNTRGQFHQQVTKLREHWDETNSTVLGRKAQLDAMLNDTHKYESKRIELEAWLTRMEGRMERVLPVAHTADLLEHQMREQKALQAEVLQYKHQFELFTQMTQRLLTLYQNDDTRHMKQSSDSLTLRFGNLNSSIVTRGKTLHAAMNSLHNFGKALDRFMAWISEAESSVDLIEREADKLPPVSSMQRRDSSLAKPPNLHLKDLQGEIENHKDVLASLNATGQKLLGTLENQDDAIMLHMRLKEMNHRWNSLKHKSIAIRNRLEGTAENWNSLLLSLRELIEWVIRKDTELSSFCPLIGDMRSLSKFEDDLQVFRRVLDEKQPIIESNLKSGRQLIASEPPLSDTSDSEAGRDLDGDARYRGEESTRELTRAVRREVTKLSDKWAALRERVASYASQSSMALKKLGVLLKTVEEVGSHLDDAEKSLSALGPFPHDPNLIDQYAQNIRKFREQLPELQRGLDDVNDQVARFSAHNVPLTPANSAAINDINNKWKSLETTANDRLREAAGRSRESTPLTPAQLATSVSSPWERSTANNKVPYYINHVQETTYWDHPEMMELLDSLSEFNHIKFSAYRTASKLRILQKKLALDHAKLQMVTDVFDEHGLRGQNDRLIDVNDMVVVLSTLYGRIASDHPQINTNISTDLCLNWLLNVYDSQRTGQMRVLSFRVGLICLCRGHLEEKYRYMFRLIADPNRQVDQRKLGLLLHDCVQVPRQLGEVAAFGGSNIEPSVRSCFTKAGKDKDSIEAVHFLAWVQQEPQSLVWLAVLHRVAASENVLHQIKCNICKACPIVGLRYRCLKCLSFDMCQRCFFDGKSGKSHKITHPMHEYCTATTAGEEMKDFTKALKNKFKSKRSLQKHTKKGYLPVQTVLEGDALESPSPSPSHVSSHEVMHSRLELYASRLAEVELRTNSNSTPDSEDEHGLIAQYCQSLISSDGPFPVPKSPLQIMASVDADQKDELEQVIRELEEENRCLQAEYEHLKSQQPSGITLDDSLLQRSEAEMLAEAKLLREHKGRLEARMTILEDHNRQLEAQLQRLRHLLQEQTGVGSPNKSGTLQTKSVTASQLAMDSPAKMNGHSAHGHGDLERAVGHLVASMNQGMENGSHSDHSDKES